MEEEEAEVFPHKEQMLEQSILAQLAASPVSQTHWGAGSRAWPLHSPAGKDRGPEAWKKSPGSTTSWFFPLRKTNPDVSGFWLSDGDGASLKQPALAAESFGSQAR